MSIKSFFSKLFGKTEEPVIEEPLETVPQKSESELLIESVKGNISAIDDFFANPQKYEGTRFNARETKAMHELYKKMIKTLKTINSYTNVGFRNIDEYYELKRIIQDLINTRDETLRDIVPELKVKVDEFAMDLRYTAYELNKNYTERRKIQEILESENDKKKFFEYALKFKEATDVMRKRLLLI